MANLERNVSTTAIVIPKPELPAGIPTIPTAEMPPRMMSDIKARRVRAVLAKDEYGVYVETWREWITQHTDYNQAEDEKDLGTVCMEEAMQFRYQCFLQRKPNDKQTQTAYNQSFERQQQARDNLAARRDLRLGITAKGNGKTVINNLGNMCVSMMAGSVDQNKLQRLEQDSRQQQLTDLNQLQLTSGDPPAAEIIEGEFEVKEEATPVTQEEEEK